MNPLSADATLVQARRCARVLIALVLVTSAIELRHEIATLPQKMSLLRLWLDPGAQHRLALGSDYAFLQRADRLLPRHASVLLLTAGRDVRHREYTAFHRALYFLTPRPVWWLTPAPPDSTWESRWWTSGPLTREEILRVAANKGATHLLALDLAQLPPIGTKVADLPGGAILALASDGLPPGAPAAEPEPLPSLWPVRVSVALMVIMIVGDLVLAALTRLGLEVAGIERAALCWTLGAGVTSIAMLWLDAAGATLDRQGAIISLTAMGGFVAVRVFGGTRAVVSADSRTTIRTVATLRPGSGQAARDPPRVRSFAAVAVLGAGFLLVAVAAIGRPLTVWDSWVLWGMRARTMFVEGGISPVIYADPSRLVTLPTYPLLVPSLEAWIYTCLGAADDRLAGAALVPFYAALPAVAYASLRRRGAGRDFALLASAALAALPVLVGIAAGVFADLPVALFTTVAAIYLVEWMERAEPGRLMVAALAGGFLPWTKREGAVIVVTLALATLFVARDRRTAWVGASAICVSALLLSGPWYAFVGLYGLSDPQFDPVSVAHFFANLDRLPSIVWRALTTLTSPAGGWVWLAAGIFALLCRPAGAAARPSALFPVTGFLYVVAMASVYVFSAYVPYQQHLMTSYPRLVAHVAPLPLLWIAYHGTPRR